MAAWHDLVQHPDCGREGLVHSKPVRSDACRQHGQAWCSGRGLECCPAWSQSSWCTPMALAIPEVLHHLLGVGLPCEF